MTSVKIPAKLFQIIWQIILVQHKITQIQIMHSRTKHMLQRDIIITDALFALRGVKLEWITAEII